MTVRIVHKNSEAEDKRPTAGQLAKGEIAVNLNAAGAFLTVKDTAGNVQQVGGVKVSASSPSDPVLGTLWVDSTDNKLYVHDGTGWRLVTGAGGGGGGGGGDVTAVNGGDGITVTTPGGPIPVVNVDLQPNASRTGGNGLEITGAQLRGRVASDANLGVVRVGSNLQIDGDGVISIDGAITGGLTYRGNLDIVGANATVEPTTRVAGDTYTSVESGAITTSGTSGVDWQDLLGDTGNTTVGDLIICKDSAGGTGNWVIVRTGGLELWQNVTGNDLEPKNSAHIITADTLADGTEATTGTGIVMSTDSGQLVRSDPKNGIEIDGGQIQIDADAIPLPGAPGTPNGNGNFGFWNRDNANTNLSPRTTGDDVFLTANATAATDERVIFRGNDSRDVSLSGPHTGLAETYNIRFPANAPAAGDMIIITNKTGAELTTSWQNSSEIPLPGGGSGNGNFGFWQRNDANNTLQPRTGGDDVLLRSANNEFLLLQGTDATPAAQTISFGAPTGAAGFSSYSLTFPTSDGNANQVLTTDGSGNLSWTAKTAAGFWSRTGTNLSPATGGDDVFLTASATDADDERIIFKESAGTTNTISIGGPNTGMTASYRAILPADVPVANDYLKVNAVAGTPAVATLEWAPAGGGASVWEAHTANSAETGSVNVVYVRPATAANRVSTREGGTALLPAIVHEGDENTGIAFAAADQINISTGGAERLRFTDAAVIANPANLNVNFVVESDTPANADVLTVDVSDDRVGINDATPTTALDVTGAIKTNVTAIADNTAFDIRSSNVYTAGAIQIANPTDTANAIGMSGVIVMSNAPTAWGNSWDHSGGAAPTPTQFPAIVPFYVRAENAICVGLPTEDMD